MNSRLHFVAVGVGYLRGLSEYERSRAVIRTDREYREMKKRVQASAERLDSHRDELSKTGISADALDRAMEPLVCFHLQLEEEIAHYESLIRGETQELVNLHGLGQMLVGLRIICGMTQRELAEKLEVSESQVSRDERNEYSGISIERASRVLDALSVDVRTSKSIDRTGMSTAIPKRAPMLRFERECDVNDFKKVWLKTG